MKSSDKGFRVVLITAPMGKGEEIARFLVEERLAACVNVVRGIRSFYWWKGEIQEDDEDLLVVKTRGDVVEELVARVKSVHPYTVPEVIALGIVEGNEDYLEWVRVEVKSAGSKGDAQAGGGEG